MKQTGAVNKPQTSNGILPADGPPLTSPAALKSRVERLAGKREEKQRRQRANLRTLQKLESYLAITDQVTSALATLSEQLFQEDLRVLQEKLTIALQEVLQQPIQFRAVAEFKRNSAVVEFSIDHDGHREDINRGQGGSVHNVLSVGLRMFALAKLDESRHRRFLVLDEQDCWLQPELVPKLVSIVHQAARGLGFQVLMISHHDVSLFEKYADRIYRFVPRGSSVDVELVGGRPHEPDPV